MSNFKCPLLSLQTVYLLGNISTREVTRCHKAENLFCTLQVKCHVLCDIGQVNLLRVKKLSLAFLNHFHILFTKHFFLQLLVLDKKFYFTKLLNSNGHMDGRTDNLLSTIGLVKSYLLSTIGLVKSYVLPPKLLVSPISSPHPAPWEIH